MDKIASGGGKITGYPAVDTFFTSVGGAGVMSMTGSATTRQFSVQLIQKRAGRAEQVAEKLPVSGISRLKSPLV